jgi:proteasome lid subunit RPN8/RPN11
MAEPEPELSSGATVPGEREGDELYLNDVEACAELTTRRMKDYREGKQDPKLYWRIKLSGVAAAKMLMHAKRGCDEGVATSGTPTEIMGMLFGYTDTQSSGTIVITDAFEIPLAGSCHDIAPFQPNPQTGSMGQEFVYFYGDEQNGVEGLVAELARDRPEGKFCGWYHSHPFETIPGKDHCWFSGIDVGTQGIQQTMFEKDGNPFVGLVVDPQTSLKDGRPHIAGFRCYDRGFEKAGMPAPAPGYRVNQSDSLESELAPDGSRMEDGAAIGAWGGQWNRYYKLKIEYHLRKSLKRP